MQKRIIRCFITSAGTLLLITASAKLASSNGSAKLLDIHDAVLHISFRHLFQIAGIIELIISLICFFGANSLLQAKLLVWLSSVLLIYRIWLSVLGIHPVCGCLGTLTDAIHFPAEAADVWMKVVLGYLWTGSTVCIILLRISRNDGRGITPSAPQVAL